MENIESVELVKLPIGITEILDDYMLVRHGLEMEKIFDPMISGMLYRIKTYILAEEIDNRTKTVRFSCKTTANWWQHFKLQLFPGWLQRKFPVKYADCTHKKKVTFRKHATYPRANILFPDKVGSLIRYKSSIEEVS